MRYFPRTLITPGQTYEYLVEVWPVGHVFLAGHQISVKLHAPPFVDSYYAYVPRMPLRGVQLGPPLPCGAQEAVRCVGQPG